MRTEANSFMVPNQKTIEAIEELESGKGERFETIEQLMNNLHEKQIDN